MLKILLAGPHQNHIYASGTAGANDTGFAQVCAAAGAVKPVAMLQDCIRARPSVQCTAEDCEQQQRMRKEQSCGGSNGHPSNPADSSPACVAQATEAFLAPLVLGN